MSPNEESPTRAPSSTTGTGRSLVCRKCGALLHGDPSCPSCGEQFRIDDAGASVSGLVEEMRDRLARALQGRYELRGLLGYGGMGAVFLAVELRLDRLVAIKVLPPTLSRDEALLARFDREARTAARLDHPGIVPIYSVEEKDDLHFFVMKFIPGSDLGEEIAGGPMDVPRARRILVDAARALAHAHERGVIHRDVKPSNIMMDQEDRVVLADFGIAKAAAASSQVTSTGQALGSPQYMSPEQFEAKDVDGRSDQYGLGMVGYHMLAGRAPFEGSSYGSVLVKQVMEYPPSLKELRPDLPADLVEALERAIRKNPDERFPDMVAFAEAVAGGSGASHPGGATAPRPAKGAGAPAAARRTRTAALLVLALAAAGIGYAVLRPDDPASPVGQPAIQDDAAAIQTDPGESPLQPPADVGAGEVQSATETAVTSDLQSGPSRNVSQGAGEGSAAPAGAAAAQPRPPGTSLPAPDPSAVLSNGFLTINAQPVFAFVEVDGIELPNSTPIFRHPLSPGTRIISIRREGYATVVDTVEIRSGNETRRSYVLIAR